MAIDAKKIAAKWSRVTQQRTEDYAEGVKNPGKDWGKETVAAEARYKEGVIKAAGEGRFGKGVKSAGTEKWQKGAVEKGINRWPEGVRVAENAQAEGFAPYADVINAVKPAPRFPRGDVRNLQRVADYANALSKKRQELLK